MVGRFEIKYKSRAEQYTRFLCIVLLLLYNDSRMLHGKKSGQLCVLVEQVAAMQALVCNLYDKVNIDFLGVKLLYQIVSSLHCAACSQEIVV